MSDCCVRLSNDDVAVCSPPIYCQPPVTGSCPDLVLVGNDEEFLGDATSNTFASDGVCNEFSSYGSEFSATSIYNQFGTYGSEFNRLSAYHPHTSTPPFLFCVSTRVAFNPVTKNEFLRNALDPDSLCEYLAANGY